MASLKDRLRLSILILLTFCSGSGFAVSNPKIQINISDSDQSIPQDAVGVHCEYMLMTSDEAKRSLSLLNMAFESTNIGYGAKLELQPVTPKTLLSFGFKNEVLEEVWTSPNLRVRATYNPSIRNIYFLEITSERQLVMKMPISFPPLFIWKFAAGNPRGQRLDLQLTKENMKGLTLGFVDQLQEPHVRRIVSLTNLYKKRPLFQLSIDVPCERLSEFTMSPDLHHFESYDEDFCRVHILTAEVFLQPPRPYAH